MPNIIPNNFDLNHYDNHFDSKNFLIKIHRVYRSLFLVPRKWEILQLKNHRQSVVLYYYSSQMLTLMSASRP